MMPGSKGLNPHELAHKWVKDLRTRPDMSIKICEYWVEFIICSWWLLRHINIIKYSYECQFDEYLTLFI